MTKVKFLIEKEGENVFAYFPYEIFNFKSPNDIYSLQNDRMSYAHLGQHSACSTYYAKECKEANFNQYNDLLRELIGQGYKDLQILNSQTIECHRPPTKGEIKFGEGATHYRNFTLAEIGINKKGDFKKWFIAKDDGLRYYTN